ncbi:unnamed protein product, partial [Closterium sp. NIES-54]
MLLTRRLRTRLGSQSDSAPHGKRFPSHISFPLSLSPLPLPLSSTSPSPLSLSPHPLLSPSSTLINPRTYLDACLPACLSIQRIPPHCIYSFSSVGCSNRERFLLFFDTPSQVLNLFKKRAALQQAQRHAWMQAQHDAYMASSARSPAAEEEDAWIVSSEDQEVPQAEAEEIAEEIYSLSMAAEGDGSENDSDPSSSCSNVAEMVGSEASSTTSGFSGSSCSGQSSNEEPSTAIAVNILCLGDYKLNRYNIYNKQYSDSALLLDLVLLLISFTVSKNVVAAVHLASRMGLLGADKSLVRGTPAARWRLLPTRRPRPGSKRVAGVQPAVVDKTMVTVSLGALQALKGCSAALGMRKQGGVGGVVFGDKKQPSRAFVVPSGGGVKQGSAAAQCKGQLERFRSLTFGACSTPSKPLDAPPAGCVKRGSSKRKQEQVGLAAAQSERKQQQVGSAASHNKRNQQQVGSAASHNKRNQQQVG